MCLVFGFESESEHLLWASGRRQGVSPNATGETPDMPPRGESRAHEMKATDSKPETEECPPRLRLSALRLWKASSRGERPICHLYAARDAAVGCVPRLTYFTASVPASYHTASPPCAHRGCVVCERPWALQPGCGEVQPSVEECFYLVLRSRNRWACVGVNETKERVFCVLRC